MNRPIVSKAMDTITHGVYVIGTKGEHWDNLMTAAWLCQVSSSPAILAVAVSSGHLTADLIKKEGQFSVSILREDQKEQALICGRTSGRNTDKTKQVETIYTEHGLPVIQGAAAVMECKVIDINTTTNHTVFFAEVTDADCYSDNVLLYHKKEFFG